MNTNEVSGKHVYLLLAAVLLWFVAAGAFSAEPALARSTFAGEQPLGAPIIYNLIPGQGEAVAQDELSRAGAIIETRRDSGVAWAAVFVDGQQRPSALMGPTRYYQSVSADITDLGPGVHSVWVVAADLQGRMGGYSWSFEVV